MPQQRKVTEENIHIIWAARREGLAVRRLRSDVECRLNQSADGQVGIMQKAQLNFLKINATVYTVHA